jgi:hypothetical protein
MQTRRADTVDKQGDDASPPACCSGLTTLRGGGESMTQMR